LKRCRDRGAEAPRSLGAGRHPLHAADRPRRPALRPITGARHGSAEVLGPLARGEDVDASEYTFGTSTEIETAAADLDWMNRGIFIGAAGRQADAVIYETYLVG
jgi:hypothetical protein